MPRRKRVLVIGDVMVDRWIEGPMTRISPEAPSPVIQEHIVTHRPGGAANVAANIAALGNPTLLCGVVGKDWEANWLRQWMTEHYGSVMVNFVEHATAPTSCKTRITCGGQQIIRLDREAHIASTETELAMLGVVQDALHRAADLHVGMIVVADYAKGALSQELMEIVIPTAAQLNIPVFVDTKPDNIYWYRGASLIKPNFKEATEMCLEDVHPVLCIGDNADQAKYMARFIQLRWSVGAVVVTRGPYGATGYDGQHYYEQSVDTKEVYDVTGAGDTFMAVLVDAAVHGRSLPEAIRRATIASTLAVQQHQTHVITRAALDAEMLRSDGNVVACLEDAARYIKWQHDAEKTVVMTNGKYRYLHQGHIESFRWAKQQGDFLVVAVNSDVSLQAMGAAPESFLPERYRAELIASQDCVDLVVLFDDVSVAEAVRVIGPNILVKGDQYATETIPGADYVARRGGEVRFAPMVPGISATILEG